MSCTDNLWSVSYRSVSRLRGSAIVTGVWLWIVLCGLTACDRVGGSRYSQLTQDADTKSAQGDFARAINLYEAALDDSPRCAEIHYKLAVLYDDKLNDPISALHHFKRYLALSPNGPHANEVEKSIKHDEITALTALSGDSVIPRSEAAQLRNENLNLRKELEARAGPRERSASPGGAPRAPNTKRRPSKPRDRSWRHRTIAPCSFPSLRPGSSRRA